MEHFKSEEKQIAASQSAVYNKLSDFSNLNKLGALPEDLLKDFSYTEDTLSVNTMAGTITLKKVATEPDKAIHLQSVVSPVPLDLSIQIESDGTAQSKLRLVAGLEVNSFVKAMIQKPIQQGLDKIANLLTMIPY